MEDLEAFLPLLVNNSQRQVAAEMLSRSLAIGELSVCSFEERTDAVWRASNLGDLWVATENIPEVDDNIFFERKPNKVESRSPWEFGALFFAALIVIGLLLILV